MYNRIKNILQKGKAKNASNTERQEMLALFHQQHKEYELKGQLITELDVIPVTAVAAPDLKKMFARLWNTIQKEDRKKTIKKRFQNVAVRVAAALIIGLFAGIYVTSVATREEPVYYTAHSPKGSVSDLKLPDGTVIFLNSGSEIKYSLNEKKAIREIFLSGEAWFQVENDKKRPFVVHTPFYNVEVTGTKFNVKAYKEEKNVVTTLEEGKVIVKSQRAKLPAGGLAMKPGQQLSFGENFQKPEIKTVNTKWFTAWKDNKLILVNMPLKELVVLLERKFGVDFVVKNENILDYHCDATFQNETIIELMEILKGMIPIKYEIVGQTIEITADETRKKEGQ